MLKLRPKNCSEDTRKSGKLFKWESLLQNLKSELSRFEGEFRGGKKEGFGIYHWQPLQSATTFSRSDLQNLGIFIFPVFVSIIDLPSLEGGSRIRGLA